MKLSSIVGAALLSATLLLCVSAQAVVKETILYNFNVDSSSTVNPWGNLLKDEAGNFYGSALSGTIFELSPNGSGGWNYTELYICPAPDCAYPFGSLVMDHAGNLYSSTYFGNVFEYSPSGSGSWTATTIYSFSGGIDGTLPSPVILDAAGNLYGANASGGSNGLGYIFELSPASGSTWSLTHLHDFNGSDGAESGANDASGLTGALIMDAAGNLYGTTGAGGSGTWCNSGCGVVFELKNNAGAWTETVLHSFNGIDGSNPDAPLLLDAAGNLFGTTTAGGSGHFGVVFETSPVSGAWRTRVLYGFTSRKDDGAYPNSALVMDGAGNLYGTTMSGGGSYHCTVVTDTGCGAAFELSPSGGTWQESILQGFTGAGNGGFPGGVIFGNDGNLYGVAGVGGHAGVGEFFELAPASAIAGK